MTPAPCRLLISSAVGENSHTVMRLKRRLGWIFSDAEADVMVPAKAVGYAFAPVRHRFLADVFDSPDHEIAPFCQAQKMDGLKVTDTFYVTDSEGNVSWMKPHPSPALQPGVCVELYLFLLTCAARDV